MKLFLTDTIYSLKKIDLFALVTITLALEHHSFREELAYTGRATLRNTSHRVNRYNRELRSRPNPSTYVRGIAAKGAVDMCPGCTSIALFWHRTSDLIQALTTSS